MKVLEHGDTYITTTCTKCNCKFAYTKSDMVFDTFPKYVKKEISYVLCPECGAYIDYKEKLL